MLYDVRFWRYYARFLPLSLVIGAVIFLLERSGEVPPGELVHRSWDAGRKGVTLVRSPGEAAREVQESFGEARLGDQVEKRRGEWGVWIKGATRHAGPGSWH